MNLISRRNFLAGMKLGAGAALLGPMFRDLLPEALGQPLTKRRLLLYFSTYSLPNRPTGAADGSLVMSAAYRSLEPYRSEMLLVDKLYNPFNRHLHGNFWPMSIAPGQNITGKNINTGDGNARAPGDISIDRHIAKAIGANDPFPSVALAPVPVERGEIGGTVLGYSADGPGKHFPATREPFRAYNTIFARAAMAGGPDPKVFLAREQSLLDFIRDDVSRMNAKLAGPERAKLDQFLDAIRGTEQRLSSLANTTVSCEKPAAPPASLDQGIGAVVNTAIKPEIIAAHIDIATTALICGLTRVVTLNVCGSMAYRFLGEDGRIGEHLMWHDQGTAAKFLKYGTYHADNLATIRKKLGAVPEGNGTVASNSLIMVMDESGGVHHLGYNDIFVLLIGTLGGRLTGGKRLTFAKQERCVSDAFVSIMNALGVEGNTFGAADRCKGPITAMHG